MTDLNILASLLRPAAQPMGGQNMLARLLLDAPSPGADMPPTPGYAEARNPQPTRPGWREVVAETLDPNSRGNRIVGGFTQSPAAVRLPDGALAALRESLVARNPGLRLWVGQAPSGHLTVSEIVVPEAARGQGVGTAVMRELTDFADQNALPMALTPDGSFGGSVARLRQFYQRQGFRPNAGRSRDLSISESMIREPRP